MNSNSCFTPTPMRAVNGPPWLGLSVLLLAGFVTIFDLFVVNVAIPSMQTGLGASFAQIGFIVAGYELAFGVLLITGGRLGDLFGRRRLFVTGMAVFTLASALCGLAPGAGFLVGARVLQGLAAALLFPQVYASIRVNFNGGDSRRAFGLLGMTLGLAAIAGQVLGGWLVHADLFGLGWRNIFLINVPIGLFAIAAARYIPESRAPQRPALDWTGVVLVSGGLTLLLVPLIEGPGQGWPAWSLWSLSSSVVLLALFHRQQEQRRMVGALPLVDMQLLAQRRFVLGVLLVLLVYSTSSSFFLCFAGPDRAWPRSLRCGQHFRAVQRGLRTGVVGRAEAGGALGNTLHRGGRIGLCGFYRAADRAGMDGRRGAGACTADPRTDRGRRGPGFHYDAATESSAELC